MWYQISTCYTIYTLFTLFMQQNPVNCVFDTTIHNNPYVGVGCDVDGVFHTTLQIDFYDSN